MRRAIVCSKIFLRGAAVEQELTAVFLDLGGVLYNLDYRRKWEGFRSLCGVSVDQVRTVLYEEKIFRGYESGRISSRGYFRKVRRGLGCALSFGQFSELWNAILVKRDSMFLIAARLSRRLSLAIVSNTNELNVAYMSGDLSTITEHLIYSCRVGYMKPDRRIFLHALRDTGADPRRSLFVDDTPENIEAAAGLGFHTHLFRSEDGLLRALAQFGVRLDGPE